MRSTALATGLLLLLLTGCTPQANPGGGSHSSRSDEVEVLTFEEGGSLSDDTVVGVHADLGDDWVFSDGGASLGYGEWANETLGCTLMLVVATPVARLPHDLPDESGSIRLTEKYGDPSGEKGVYLHRVVDGGMVQMASITTDGIDGGRFTIAREFSVLKSALIVDIGCRSGTDPREVLDRIDVSATVTVE